MEASFEADIWDTTYIFADMCEMCRHDLYIWRRLNEGDGTLFTVVTVFFIIILFFVGFCVLVSKRIATFFFIFRQANLLLRIHLFRRDFF